MGGLNATDAVSKPFDVNPSETHTMHYPHECFTGIWQWAHWASIPGCEYRGSQQINSMPGRAMQGMFHTTKILPRLAVLLVQMQQLWLRQGRIFDLLDL